MKNDQVKEKLSKTVESRYGVKWACMRKEARAGGSNDSAPNRAFKQVLLEVFPEHCIEQEFPLENRSFDFKVDDVLIEVDPAATHNSTIPIFYDRALDPSYHRNKTELAEKHGYRCIHVWDWDDVRKVVSTLVKRDSIFARNTSIVVPSKDQASQFLRKYHLQGYVRYDIAIALE